MPITFDRSICCDIHETISREWLITNGLGGYASGTVAGTLTRMQQGLLVASLSDEVSPRLLLAKIDEEIQFDERTYYLGTNEYRDGTMNPAGFVHLENFWLEEGFPHFTYRIGGFDGLLLEKRIWMPVERNTTYIQYRVTRPQNPDGFMHKNVFSSSSGRNARVHNGRVRQEHTDEDQRALTLTILPFAAYRPYNEPQYGNNEWHFRVQTHQADDFSTEVEKQKNSNTYEEIAGCTIRANEEAHPYHIFAVGNSGSETNFLPTGVWYWNLLRRLDRKAGLAAIDDLYLPGVFRTKLWPGKDSTVTIIVTTEELSSQTFDSDQFELSYKSAVEDQLMHKQTQHYSGATAKTIHSLPILPIFDKLHPSDTDEEFNQCLLQDAHRFFAKRALSNCDPTENQFPSLFFNNTEMVPVLIPGYYNMQDNTREMLIALPGLALATGQHSEARHILHYLARYFKQGLLPNRLPTLASPLKDDDYQNIDTSLWYFYALDHYIQTTGDTELLADVYQQLVEVISWYMQGTYHDIHANAQDGLLEARHQGTPLTWMDALVHETPVTPRYGKPVEVNALWYHALCLMHEWSQLLYQKGSIRHKTTCYQEQSILCKKNFNGRFWYADGNYLYDVVDGPDGDDISLRPNQLLAFSLRFPVLDQHHRRSVLDLITSQLVTPFGLRTLAPKDAAYHGRLEANFESRQGAIHQGCVWPWLLGPYVDALLCVESSAHPTKNSGDHVSHRERVWQIGLDLLAPFQQHLHEGMLGMFGSAFDGDFPHTTRCFAASATSTGELLRVYNRLAYLHIKNENQVLTL